MDNVLEGDPNFYWGPTTISVVNNFTYPGQLGNYYITNNGYDGVWEGQTMALQFTRCESGIGRDQEHPLLQLDGPGEHVAV